VYLNLLNYIVCPNCKQELTLQSTEEVDNEIISGILLCNHCNIQYPIIRAIPRFIKDIKSDDDLRRIYADSFGHQWTTYNWLRDEDEFEFFQITDLKPDDFNEKKVLDAGCGGGRIARFLVPKSGEYIGLDYSIAVEKAYNLCKGCKNANFIQCDINNHPFRSDSFDIVYSHGVLHHTPDTKYSFDNLPPVVKKGGILYIAVFRKTILPLRCSDSFFRAICNKLSIPTMDKVCGGLSYLCYLPKAVFFKGFFWFSLQKTHEIRKCCLYDWYAPQYHHEHTVHEVIQWFENSGFEKIKYINAWPYAPTEEKYKIPTFWDNLRLGLLLGVIGTKK
jgi:SAM-dependent methyltransferase